MEKLFQYWVKRYLELLENYIDAIPVDELVKAKVQKDSLIIDFIENNDAVKNSIITHTLMFKDGDNFIRRIRWELERVNS